MNIVLQLWECGIEQCKELCIQHETITYDYVKLAELHVSIDNITLWIKINYALIILLPKLSV